MDKDNQTKNSMINKKKVNIITILDVANFGSMLQAYALATIIERFGYSVEFINYWRYGYTTADKVRTFLKDSSLGNLLRRVVFALSALLFYAPLRRRLRRFVTERFHFTRPYHSIEGLRNNPPSGDIYLSGSDQIWNGVHNNGIDHAFYLDFGKSPRIAYAASAGMEEFSGRELPIIKDLLSNYDAISVRESQTCSYLKSLGLKDVRHVLDPSLLLTMEEWKRIINYKSNTSKDKYLLVYSVERFDNDFVFSQAKKLAQELNLKVYVVCTTYPVNVEKYNFSKVYALASVSTFLRLMINASFVVACSFHGMAFAINFNKEFVSILVNKFNIRMESLANLLNITHRIIRNEDISCKLLLPINYAEINIRLEQERKSSLQFLHESLDTLN